MAKERTLICPSCGSRKNPPGSTRCGACGAKIEELASNESDPNELRGSRYRQDGTSVLWIVIATGVQAILTAAIVFGLPHVIRALDFEGGMGMVVCVPVWFVGGFLIGMVSPGRTFVEPATGTFLVAVPTTVLLLESQTVRIMPPFLYVIFAAVGVLLTLIGAYLGERLQMGPRPVATD